MKITRAATAFAALLSFAPCAFAQTKPCPDPVKPAPEPRYERTFDCKTLPTRTAATDCAQQIGEFRVFHLANVTQQNDANEILVALRNMFDPSTKMFLIASTQDIVTDTYPANADRMADIIRALDRPRKTFRITYTFTDADAGSTIAPKLSVDIGDGQNMIMKRGNKVPVVVANVMKEDGSVGSRSQYTYLDVGLLIDTTVSSNERGAFIKYKVEQSAIGENTPKSSPNEPVVNQTTLNGVIQLVTGKPETLGSVELPGSRHNVTVSAQLEEVP